MQLFRKLAGNIFFKIILAFIALSFVLFGVSGFILSGPNSWVAKIGGKTISYSDFNKEMQKTRDMILQNNKSEEALKYLDSDQFKSDVLGRIVNGILIEKLREEFGVEASKKLILEAVAKDKNFKDKDGKFDREAFKNFLTKNGLDEEKYVNLIQNDVVATMIIQTMSLAAPINEKELISREQFKQEKRTADVIKITAKDIAKVATPSEEEITKFFEAHKKSYAVEETRKVSFLRFSKNDFAKDLQVSDDEIAAEYEKNKDKFQKPESRDIYHVLFEKEEDAKKFIAKLEGATTDKSKVGNAFLKLAKEIQNKDAKAVTLKNITQKDMIPDLANPIFKLAINQHSEVLKSPLGFHVFLLNSINEARPIALAEAKSQIKAELLKGREDKVLQSKVSEIDDTILSTNSLSETAKKFNISANLSSVEINQAGKNSKGDASFEIKGLDEFAEHAFALKKDESSKIFFAKSSGQYYAVKVEEISPARELSLEEVKNKVIADATKNAQNNALKTFAESLAKELQANPQNFNTVAAKHKLSVVKNKQFSRFSYLSFQGHQIPIADKFSAALFEVNPNQVTEAVQTGNEEFGIAVLRSIQTEKLESAQIDRIKSEASQAFVTEVLQGYNAAVMKKYPVKINEKILGKKEQN